LPLQEARARIAQTDRRALILVKRPRSVVRTKNADLFFRLLPLCGVQGQGQGSSQLRYATRDATGSRGGSIGSVHARARRHRDRAPWSSSGDRESRAGRMASHVTAIMNAALSRARRSGPVLASDQRLRPLAVWLMPPETLPSACLFAGNGAVENVATRGVIFIRTEKIPMPPRSTPPFFLLASGFRLNAGLVL